MGMYCLHLLFSCIGSKPIWRRKWKLEAFYKKNLFLKEFCDDANSSSNHQTLKAYTQVTASSLLYSLVVHNFETVLEIMKATVVGTLILGMPTSS